MLNKAGHTVQLTGTTIHRSYNIIPCKQRGHSIVLSFKGDKWFVQKGKKCYQTVTK